MRTRPPLPELARRYLSKEPHALDPEERNVLQSFEARRPISRDAADIEEAEATFWDRLADRVAAIGGSWGFIFGFFGVLVGWMLLNTDILTHWGHPFDPYPYILLNLFLSLLASIQAPVILMSQNRSAERDREHAQHDYDVNIEAKREIEELMTTLARIEIEKLDKIMAALKV